MNHGNAKQSLRDPAPTERPAPALPDAALAPQDGEYTLIQLEALAGIALKQATRELPLSSAWAG